MEQKTSQGKYYVRVRTRAQGTRPHLGATRRQRTYIYAWNKRTYIYTRGITSFMFFSTKHKKIVPIICSFKAESVLLPCYSFPAKKSLKKVSFFKSLVYNVLRVQRRNFSKISSKNIWLVMKKSLPLHSQIRNEAYNTNKHSADNGSNER